MSLEIIDSESDKRANDVLEVNGVHDCIYATGVYRNGDHFIRETYLVGGSNKSRAKAKKLLPQINFPKYR
jgi:hypothetical protein